MLEARKHLVQYLHGFPGVKEYRTSLVQVESMDDIERIIEKIAIDQKNILQNTLNSNNPESQMMVW
jgi:tRNA-dihydrouridine synthase